MSSKNNHLKSRALSMFLVMLMLLSTTAAIASTASASVARSYTTNRDPHDVAIGDFNCDGHNDLAVATDGTHTISILWNDGTGDFSERQDIWVSKNTSRNADWDEFSNVQSVEVGEFTGDSAIDIVIFQRNNPFKTDDNGAPAGEPGNVTIIENGGCNEKTWSIGERFTHFYAFDLAVGDADQDGNDDIYVLDLLTDLSSQRVVLYRGPITSSTQGTITTLGSSQQNVYQNIEIGDWGETETVGITGTCTDDDIWLQRRQGVDYNANQVTNPGHDDNMTIIEYSCLTNSYPATYTFSATNPPINSHVINMNTDTSSDFAIGDMDGDDVIDAMVLIDGNLENVTYVTATSVGTWTTPSLAYFGPYLSWNVAVSDLNGDQEPDFVNPTLAYQLNTTDSAGGSTSSFYLNFPTSVQVTLSDGNGGHLSPLSYAAGRRPSVVDVGQLAGASGSADDLVIGHTNWRFSNGWRDNFGWEGQYDTVSVIEMDNLDLSVSGVDISPVDEFFGIVGEGTRDIEITVTNTGMNVLNGQQATLDVKLQVVDSANSTNTTVYEMDWDAPENKAACAGCTWAFEEYVDQSTMWHEEKNHTQSDDEYDFDYGPAGEAESRETRLTAPDVDANYNNPTDFMWAGYYDTNSTGATWTGYGKNWDDAMILQDVDLSGSDRAFMSVDLFRHLGHGVLGSAQNGQFLANDVWDDLAMIEVGSTETGWSTIACPQSAQLDGACASSDSMWGGFDGDRTNKQDNWRGSPEGTYYYNVYSFGTYYGWDSFSQNGVGEFDLSPWAGETVDIRFRLRTGFEGSISDDNESLWSGRDGYAVDNLKIYKQTTAFEPNPQEQQAPVPLNNLGPGQEYTTSITADLLNDTTYRISAVLSGNSWDEQSQNDELIAYVTPFNLYDPMVEQLEYFNPGGLYPEGLFDIEVTTNNYGNTPVDFDIVATVFNADPSSILCGASRTNCTESFEGGADGIIYTENQPAKGAVYNDSSVPCQDIIFDSAAYWFGHPCDTGSRGYGDAWNESLTIPDVDLTSLSGDFVSLNFEHYADTFYTVGADQTSIEAPGDYAVITLDAIRGSSSYEYYLFGQWNDYNEDGTCQVDENEDNIVNETEPFDTDEITFIGDERSTDGSSPGALFFNTNGLVITSSIDLTHLYVYNVTGPSDTWGTECIDLKGSTVDINFEFQSDDDGRNGMNDGFKGIGFNNISLQEFTFYEDNSYTVSRTNVDAQQSATSVLGNHEFVGGVYKIEIETIFDNTIPGKSWFNDDELSTSNNRKTVIFDVESVNIVLETPNSLGCLKDNTLECVMPIDSSLTHDWTIRARNGVLPGDYIFNMDIFDMTDNSIAHSTTAGPSQPLDRQEVVDVTFTPWNGWVDGHKYNISFSAELANGNPSGNVRYFHAAFADTIDVAILGPTITTKIKQDLDILGMTYTQYEINDWDTYFDSGWFTHYDKIVLPWVTYDTAKDISENGNGKGYFQKLGTTANKDTLEGFMYAGGTIQAHLGPQGSQVYGTNDGLPGRLPFGLSITNKNLGDSPITFSETDFADPYHPFMDNVDLAAFQGFDNAKTVATAVLDTTSQSAKNVPEICGGFSESKRDGTFQRIIRQDGTPADQKATILGVCSYQSGGLIVTTMDVEAVSDRANSSTLPLLGNMLKYQVTPYPDGFGVLGDGLDIKINGVTPENDASTGGYEKHYMKSDAEITFSFVSDTAETLQADWILDGPTSWDEETMASGTDHTSITNPTMSFCKKDLSSATECTQGETWDIKLILHDDLGHSRVIMVTVETNDVYADASRPTADAQIDMRDAYANQVSFLGTNTIQSKEWDVHQIRLNENDAEVTIYLDAGNSSDADALEGNGIERYEWKVLFDAPYGDDDFAIEGHDFVQTAASDGLFAYTFRNITTDATGVSNTEIRVELVVYDGADKFSEKHRMYFVVVANDFGDDEPVVQLDVDLNNSRVVSPTITVSGTVLSGAETQNDVYVEIAFMEDSFSASAIDKFNMENDETWAKTKVGLGDGDTFSLTLSLEDFYTNKSVSQRVFIRIYEGQAPDERHVIVKWQEFQLAACQGLEAPPEALADGGEFILDSDGDCQWSGAWTFADGEWSKPQADSSGDSAEGAFAGLALPLALGALVLMILVGTMFFLRKGSEDNSKDFSMTDSGFGGVIDQTEQYVQQLIAQGYPEETARAYAQQYAAQASAAAAPAAAAPVMDDAVYQQYYQQFTSQGYDAQTAAAYAQQYAMQYAQSQQ